MPDYGHALSFGTFITPLSGRPQEAVALAQLTEAAGLDLVAFQDHPYQPAFLDTWTLLTWVAAATRTVTIVPDVLNVPLRPPAVLARAAASLDLLSDGRLELGLGAGGFWDAIAAMGARRLTPGQSVDALTEAIDVIRQIWDVDADGDVHVDGEHHRVVGARRGPAPAHPISLWLGAYKPRMLELTGGRADGWLPSLPYLDADALAVSHARIDEAALAAGRDPRDVRRLLNVQGRFASRSGGFLDGPAEQWVQELLPYVLEHGFSAFILSGDDPDAVRVWGEEVAPAVREAVAQERRPAERRDALPISLATDAVGPGDREYRALRSTYVHRGSPRLILRPRDAAGVADALGYAREQRAALAVRSGGHGISGRSTNDDGIVIDVGHLNAIELLDPASGLVRVGAGARWGEVAAALQPHGLAISSGDYGDVGVGGLATAGGVGLLGRLHGLTIDHVVAADVVLADGTAVRADATHHADLFWALRGAGGNFGIVTAFDLEATPVGEVVHSTMVFKVADPAEALVRWGTAVEAAPRALTSFAYLIAQPGGAVIQLSTVVVADDLDAAAALRPLSALGPLVDDHARRVPYAALVPPRSGPRVTGQAPPAMRSGLVDHVSPAVGAGLSRLLRSGAAPLLQLRAIGGAVNDVDPMATAFAHRHQSTVISAAGLSLDQLNGPWDAVIAPHVTGVYLSFETDRRPERLLEAFPPATLDRLRDLKARYDGDNVFNANFPIVPAVPSPS